MILYRLVRAVFPTCLCGEPLRGSYAGGASTLLWAGNRLLEANSASNLCTRSRSSSTSVRLLDVGFSARLCCRLPTPLVEDERGPVMLVAFSEAMLWLGPL